MIKLKKLTPMDVIMAGLIASLPPEDRHEEKVLKIKDERRENDGNEKQNG